uniref:Uncharacterized protein n=1 Tax=Oxytricha fallax TaxID=5944 RepID=O00905_OXYFA|nr:unknown [Oxytricha fallax]
MNYPQSQQSQTQKLSQLGSQMQTNKYLIPQTQPLKVSQGLSNNNSYQSTGNSFIQNMKMAYHNNNSSQSSAQNNSNLSYSPPIKESSNKSSSSINLQSNYQHTNSVLGANMNILNMTDLNKSQLQNSQIYNPKQAQTFKPNTISSLNLTSTSQNGISSQFQNTKSNFEPVNSHNISISQQNHSQDRSVNIQTLYQERLNHMQSQLKNIYTRIANDDIANTMKENYVSQEFIYDRIKEIVEEALINEKEMQIEKSLQEIAQLKTELAQTQVVLQNQSSVPGQYQEILEKQDAKLKYFEQENQKLKENVVQLSTGFKQTDDHYSTILQQKEDELKFCKQQFKQSQAQIDNYEIQMMDKQKSQGQMQQELYQIKRLYEMLQEEFQKKIQKFDTVQNQYQEQNNELGIVKAQNFEMQLQIQKMISEFQQQQETSQIFDKEKQDLLEKFNNFGEQLQKQQLQELEKAKEQFQNKLSHYKSKINDLKSKHELYEQELEKERAVQYNLKSSFDIIIQQMKEDMRRIKDEWENRLHDEELEHQRHIVAQQSQHSIQIQNMKNECTLIFDQKVSQIQLESQKENERIRRECDDLKYTLDSKVKSIELEYIKISKHEEILNSELQNCESTLTDKIKKVKEQMQNEIVQRLEEKELEREKSSQSQLKAIKAQLEQDKTQALQEMELKMQKQFDWQLKELQEEHSHELRSVTKKAEIQREDIVSQNQKLLHEMSYLKQDLDHKSQLLQEVRGEIENQQQNEQQRIDELEQDNQALRNECERLSDIVEVNQNEFQNQLNEVERQNQKELRRQEIKWNNVLENIQKQVHIRVSDLKKQQNLLKSELINQFQTEFTKFTQKSFKNFIRVVRSNNYQEQLVQTLDQKEDYIQQLQKDKQYLEQELQNVQQTLDQTEDKLQRLRKDRENELQNQKREYFRVLETAKKEVQRKYSDELKNLKNYLREFKKRFLDQLLSKEKEIRQLHLQHQLEKTQLQENLQSSQSKIRQLQGQFQDFQLKHDQERQQLETQKKNWIEEFKKKYHFKEKEIEGLTSLISKSYMSINSSIDNIRVAAKLESDIEELTRKAQQKTGVLRSDSSQRSVV